MAPSIRKTLVTQCPRCHTSFTSSLELYNHYTTDGCSSNGNVAENFSLNESPDLEWEYEYSTTETETLYVTLDLPVARSDANVEEGPKGGRLTKRKDKWLNSTHLPFIEEKRKARAEGADALDENEAEPAEKAVDGHYMLRENGLSLSVLSHAASTSSGPGNIEGVMSESHPKSGAHGTSNNRNIGWTSQADMAPTQATTGEFGSSSFDGQEIPHDIQILELHNKSPIIVYRNQQFECDWTQNIGTELLFIKHSEIASKSDGHFPVVKQLPGEVDLLAVSGVRVVGRPINIKAKKPSGDKVPKPKRVRKVTTQTTVSKEIDNSSNNSNSVALENTLQIPIGAAAAEDRKAQAKFLEKLSIIKVGRGELDEITVTAIPRKDKRAKLDRQKLRLKELRTLRDKRITERRKLVAKMRIQELDDMDAEADERERTSNANSSGQNGQGAKMNENSVGLRKNPEASQSRDTATAGDPSNETISMNHNAASSGHQAQNDHMHQGHHTHVEDDDDEEDGEDYEYEEEEYEYENDQGVDIEEGQEEYDDHMMQDEDYDMDDDQVEDSGHDGNSQMRSHGGEVTDTDMDDAT